MEVDGDAVALADAVDDTDTTVREAEGVAVTRGERDDEVDADWEAVADEERVDVLDAGGDRELLAAADADRDEDTELVLDAGALRVRDARDETLLDGDALELRDALAEEEGLRLGAAELLEDRVELLETLGRAEHELETDAVDERLTLGDKDPEGDAEGDREEVTEPESVTRADADVSWLALAHTDMLLELEPAALAGALPDADCPSEPEGDGSALAERSAVGTPVAVFDHEFVALGVKDTKLREGLCVATEDAKELFVGCSVCVPVANIVRVPVCDGDPVAVRDVEPVEEGVENGEREEKDEPDVVKLGVNDPGALNVALGSEVADADPLSLRDA